MAIERTFELRFVKAMRSLEQNRRPLGAGAARTTRPAERQRLSPCCTRLRNGATPQSLADRSGIDAGSSSGSPHHAGWRWGRRARAQARGLLRRDDRRAARRPRGERDADLQARRPVRGRVRGSHALLLLLLGRGNRERRCGCPQRSCQRVGPDPHRQGIEFDYCSVHAAWSSARRASVQCW